MLVSWSQVLCTVPHNTQFDRCYLLVVFKPAKASCHSPAAATPGCPTSLGISSHSRDGRVAKNGSVAAHGGFAAYGCALPSNRVTEVGCWGAFVKVDGFSQAMEFEEHRGTVIYSTVNMFGQLCWRSWWFVDLMHHPWDHLIHPSRVGGITPTAQASPTSCHEGYRDGRPKYQGKCHRHKCSKCMSGIPS